MGSNEAKKPRTNPEIIEIRRGKALDLRISGKSYRTIGKALGISGKTAFDDVKRAMERQRRETNDTLDHHRALQLSRLDRAVEGIWPAVKKGDKEAARVLVRLEKRRAELLGLDAPTKHELDLNAIVEASPAAAARLVRETFGGPGGKDPAPGGQPAGA